MFNAVSVIGFHSEIHDILVTFRRAGRAAAWPTISLAEAFKALIG